MSWICLNMHHRCRSLKISLKLFLVGLKRHSALASTLLICPSTTVESPGHWIDVADNGDIFIGSLTANVFRWYDAWMETEEAAQAERP